jgi:hypothetical protein
MPTWSGHPSGLNHAPAYQVSGEPYATSSISTNAITRRIVFPQVTRWVRIINNDATGSCRVGFSALGIGGARYSSSAGGTEQPNPGYLYGHNYFTIPSASFGDDRGGYASDSGVMEWKLTEIWINGSGDVSVLAGLTSIPPQRASGSWGPSYSGSAGVG